MSDLAIQKRRPFLMPIGLMALTLMVGTALLMVAGWWLVTANSTLIIVIRHAEKVESGQDPPLTEAGQARAAQLARMFGDAADPMHLDAIYVTQPQRSRMTAAPLADRLGLTPTVVASADPKALARRVLREHAGDRVLIVAHADTMPALIAALSGEREVAAIDVHDYGTLYIVTVPRIGRANLLRVNY